MSGFKQDLLYVVRLLIKKPGFTAVIVISLALGIGANTMIFTLVNAFLLQPLPITDPDRVAVVWFTPPQNPNGRATATRRNCQALRERNTTFESIGCLQNASATIGTDAPGSPAPEMVNGQRITADLPVVLGVRPVLGRWFTLEEQRDLTPVVLISYDQWQSRFGGTPDVIGKTIRVDSLTMSIIGVMPADFNFFGNQTKYWEPWKDPAYAIGSPARILLVFARLKHGVAAEDAIPKAQSEMDAFAATLSQEMPQTNKDWKILVEPVSDVISSGTQGPLLTFQGAVIFVLLIACANVAGLLLAQGSAQSKELAVRSALGSSRWRIVRQLLTESVMLALMGGILGFFVGWAGFQLFINALPQIIGQVPITSLNPSVLLFTLGLSVVTGIVFGILPALQISRVDLMDALRENSRSATATAAKQRLRSVFVVVQVSLALVLLIGAGLLMKSFLNLHSLPVGFDYNNMTTFLIQFPQGGGFLRETGQTTTTGSMEIEFNQRISQVSEQIRERLAGIPGVQGATAIGVTPPLSGGARQYAFTIDGAPPVANPAERPSAQWFPVMSEYFQTLEMSAARGRLLTARDTIAGPPVVVISQTAASKFFPNEDPVGKRIQVDFFNDQPREIVGVVADIRQNMQAQEPAAQMYVPYAQLPQIQAALTALGAQYVTFLVRSTGDLRQITEAMRTAVADADSTQAISNMRTMEEVVGLQLLLPWIYSTLLTIFGSVAVLLSVVGIYGIMAHSVNQRTGEIGVRMALGASSGDVLKLILKRGVILIGIGVIIGIPIAFAITRVVQSVLYGVSPTDPMTFVVALVSLSAAGFLACYIPARRALKIDPIVALRAE